MSDNKSAAAMQAFQTVCNALDAREWKYNKNEAELSVDFGVSGDDIPMKIYLFVDKERELVRLLSPLMFDVGEDKRMEMALAVCAASYGMCDGNFEYTLKSDTIVFKMVATYRDGCLAEDTVQYLISCACAMVDNYNDKFLAIDKGMLSITDFIKEENK